MDASYITIAKARGFTTHWIIGPVDYIISTKSELSYQSKNGQTFSLICP